jgi:hypothetical protein
VGFGVETVGIDAARRRLPSRLSSAQLPPRCGPYELTQLANLDALPVVGALLVVAPLKLVGGTADNPSRRTRLSELH